MEKESIQAEETPVAVNLSDLYLYYSYDPVNYPAWLLGTECNRFYIGSSFCEKYFIKSLLRAGNEICSFAKEYHRHLSVVVPVPSDRWLEHVKKNLLKFLMEQMVVDEVVVNDYAMLSFVSDLRERSGRFFRIAAGRLFFKNYRDPRYMEQQNSKTVCLFPRFLHGRVEAVELDRCSVNMDVSFIPEEIEIRFHYPFTYVTSTKYCEFASGFAPDPEKFRTDGHCGLKCMNALIYTEANGTELLHLGQGVYAENPGTLECSRPVGRYLYWPLREFLEMEGKMQ